MSSLSGYRISIEISSGCEFSLSLSVLLAEELSLLVLAEELSLLVVLLVPLELDEWRIDTREHVEVRIGRCALLRRPRFASHYPQVSAAAGRLRCSIHSPAIHSPISPIPNVWRRCSLRSSLSPGCGRGS